MNALVEHIAVILANANCTGVPMLAWKFCMHLSYGLPFGPRESDVC